MAMVLQAIRRHRLLEFGSQLEALQANANQWNQQRKRKNKKRQEEHWDVRQTTVRQVDDEQQQQQSLTQEYAQIEQRLILQFPEIVSRIQHATSALVMEVSRGFFLPFCTVALCGLARIRALILQMGRFGITELQALQSNMTFVSQSGSYDEAMHQFLVDTTTTPEYNGKRQREEMRNHTLASLGLKPRKLDTEDENTPDGNNNTTDSPEDLMMMDEDDKERPPSKDTITDASSNDDDIGEAMTSFHAALDDDSQKNDMKKKAKPVDTLDRNLNILEDFKKSSKTKKKKKSKKREEGGVSPKLNKKKKSKGDFFDELFD
jgi:hypothetical protein